MLISNPLKKVFKRAFKKLLAYKSVEIMYFSPFSTVYTSSQPSNFLSVIVLATFSTDSKSALFENFYAKRARNASNFENRIL
jgi:hypothetical protein